MRINKNFNVKGQHITCTDDTRIIKGNKNLYYAVFHVDELWDDIDAKACFTVDEEPYIMPLNRVGNTLECEIPYPANSGIVFGVGIFGGDLISTDIVYTSTTPGIPIDGANPPEPIPDWFDKMEDIARNAMETANSVKEQADSGVFKGDPFTYDDFTSEQLAKLKGEPGYTPQKGIDYFTESEVAEIVNKAAEAAGRTEETDPTVPAWAKAANKPTYTASEVGARPDTWTPSASEVGADPSGTAAGAVSEHNASEDAHRDIRELIESVTTGKVSVSDIIDNLTTNVSNKPLSAAQGVVLKGLIDALQTAVNAAAKATDLTSHTGNTTAHITAAERTKWNQAVTDVGNLSEEIVDHENDTTKHITSAERTKWNKNTTDITALNEALANMQGTFVDSVDEMTDTTKKYVLKSTGTVWEYKSATTEQEVTVTDELDDTTYYDNSRFGSSATNFTDGFNSQNGYHITPLIDLTKEKYIGKTIQIHFEGAHYISESDETYIQNRGYSPNGTVLFARSLSNPTNAGHLGAVSIKSYTIESNTSAVLTVIPPVTYGSAAIEIGYFRFCGQGAVADSHIYITYKSTQTVTGYQWVDTGVHYGSIGLDEETAAKISELNNEGSDPSTIKLLSAPVLDFYNSDAYPDDDYTVSHLSKITYPCRADVPVPFIAKWSHNENAMRTTLVVDTKAIGTVNPYRMRIYDVTGFDNYPIYNLLPNTTYYYKVTHVLSDGSLVEAKSGSFATSNETFRLLYIEGTQNVRDLGGWTGLNGKKVKYGKIIRGAALSDSTGSNLIVTGKGRLALGELKIQAELNLGAIDNETSIAANCAYKKIGYNNYAGAITGEVYRAQFKEALEWIVSCLDGTLAQTGLYTVERNVYMHCQGGCDRTGTLSFQLLGLLGVSESDLAKEYELSSFSDVGFGRLRTTTKAVDTYDYVGMVEAIKAYSGTTITDKFYNFAIDCGISADTITAFRNLMLE